MPVYLHTSILEVYNYDVKEAFEPKNLYDRLDCGWSQNQGAARI